MLPRTTAGLEHGVHVAGTPSRASPSGDFLLRIDKRIGDGVGLTTSSEQK